MVGLLNDGMAIMAHTKRQELVTCIMYGTASCVGVGRRTHLTAVQLIVILNGGSLVALFPGLYPAFVACSMENEVGLEYFITQMTMK